MVTGDPSDGLGGVSRPGLEYPFEVTPVIDSGQAIDIVPGIRWLRMSVPGPLRCVNVYVVADAGGWTIVDTGLRLDATTDAWRFAFEQLSTGPIRRVVATHMHPDHVGMAGWIIGMYPGATLWMSRVEYLSGRVLAADITREMPGEAIAFYRSAGWDMAALEDFKARFKYFGEMLHPLPDSYRRLIDGDRIEIDGDEWRVVVGAGHSLEHVCLWQPERGLFLSGDQVLPKISPNVSLFPMEPYADPLGEWLASLARIRTIVPDDVLVLPGHDVPFRGLHARIDDLIRGHEQGLARLQRLLVEPRRAVDTFEILFKRPVGPKLLQLATGEALAHLNRLRVEGRAECTVDANGIAWWYARRLDGPLSD